MNKGTTISISYQEPATFDAAGFEALEWRVIGKVVDEDLIKTRTKRNKSDRKRNIAKRWR